MRRYGPEKIDSNFKNRIRHSFTAAVTLVGQEQQAMSLLANYFYDNVFRWMMLDRMKEYTKRCFEQLMYI